MSQLLAAAGDWLNKALVVVLQLLPKSPFVYLEANPTVTKWLGYVNYFIPIDFMVSVGSTWLVAVGIYYVVSVILRLVKAVE